MKTRQEKRLRRLTALAWIVSVLLVAAVVIALTVSVKAQKTGDFIDNRTDLGATTIKSADFEVIKPKSGGFGFNDDGRLPGDDVPATEPRVLRYLGTFHVTGYAVCEHCCGKTDGITASCVPATVGRTVAADRSIPFGTVLYIEGIGDRVVEDRGVGAGCLDVLCEDHAACYALTGEYEVYVVEGGENDVENQGAYQAPA